MKKYLSIASILMLFSFVFLGFKASAQSTTCFTSQIYYLQYGSRDASTKGEVTKLQNFLIQKGFLGANPSGYFGPATKSAVISYQKSKGLTAQGFVGNMTRNVMNGDGCDVNSVNTNQNIPTARKIEPVIGAENTLSNNSSFDLYGTNLSMVSKILFKGDGFEIYSDVLSISNHDYYLTTNIIFNSISNMKSGTNKVNVILIGKDGKQYSTSLYIEIFNNSISNTQNNNNLYLYKNSNLNFQMMLPIEKTDAYIKSRLNDYDGHEYFYGLNNDKELKYLYSLSISQDRCENGNSFSANNLIFTERDVSGGFSGMESAGIARSYCIVNGDLSYNIVFEYGYSKYYGVQPNVVDIVNEFHSELKTLNFQIINKWGGKEDLTGSKVILNSLSPNSVSIGSTLYINGSGFSSTPPFALQQTDSYKNDYHGYITITTYPNNALAKTGYLWVGNPNSDNNIYVTIPAKVCSHLISISNNYTCNSYTTITPGIYILKAHIYGLADSNSLNFTITN